MIARGMMESPVGLVLNMTGVRAERGIGWGSALAYAWGVA